MKLSKLTRAIAASTGLTVDPETRTVTFPISSETPVQRWFGNEVLSHDKGAVDLSRLNDGAPLLFNHNMDDVRGVVESAQNDPKSKRASATVRLAKTPAGDELMGMINDGIIRNVSILYRINDFDVDDAKSSDPTFRATSWIPYEVSFVSVPADPTVGIGRSGAFAQMYGRKDPDEEIEVRVRGELPEKLSAAAAANPQRKVMTPEEQTAADARLRQESIDSERQRIADVTALGESHKVDAEVIRGMIQKGATIEQARGTVLEIIAKRTGAADVALAERPDNLGLERKQKTSYSIIKAIRSMVDQEYRASGAASFEIECSNAIAKRTGKSTGGLYLPSDLTLEVDGASREATDSLIKRMLSEAKRTAYTTGNASQGGNIVQTSLLASSFIEILRNKSRVMQSGARTLSGLTGDVAIPRQNGTGTAYWIAEASAPTESNMTFDQVTMSPKTLGAKQRFSRLMMLQSTPDIEMLAREDIMALMALGVDAAALFGTGTSGQPTGIANTTGIGSIVGAGGNGTQISIDDLVNLETLVAAANAPEDSLAYLCNAVTVGALKRLKATTGTYLWSNLPLGQRGPTPGEINGYPVIRSNQARSNLTQGTSNGVCSEVYFGNWSELLIGEWGVMELMANPYNGSDFDAGNIILRALQSIDIAVRHPVSFAMKADALTA